MVPRIGDVERFAIVGERDALGLPEGRFRGAAISEAFGAAANRPLECAIEARDEDSVVTRVGDE